MKPCFPDSPCASSWLMILAPRLIGYRVTNQVRVVVRRIVDLGALLDKVVTAGANQINDVTFAINEAQSFEDTARRKAMADAHR